MTTKAPASVTAFPAESLERTAYDSVADIPTQEPNDRNRLGYCVWMWLVDRKGSLDDAIRFSGCRTNVVHEELVQRVKQRLKEKGIEIS